MLTDIAVLPIGVMVDALTFDPGAELAITGDYDLESFTIIQGSGWVDSSESGRQALAAGTTVFVPDGDVAVFGTDGGMLMICVRGGWMPPR
jgi:hypothetical protein